WQSESCEQVKIRVLPVSSDRRPGLAEEDQVHDWRLRHRKATDGLPSVHFHDLRHAGNIRSSRGHQAQSPSRANGRSGTNRVPTGLGHRTPTACLTKRMWSGIRVALLLARMSGTERIIAAAKRPNAAGDPRGN